MLIKNAKSGEVRGVVVENARIAWLYQSSSVRVTCMG